MLQAFLEKLTDPVRHEWVMAHHEQIAEKRPLLEQIPAGLDPRVANLIRSSGIAALYSHQAEAIKLALEGKNVVLATTTASGKTLAYQVPVIDRLIRSPDARGLFLFPLKALERDQRDAFLSLAGASGLTAAIYDGDIPDSERRKIRKNPPRVLITNPDMLHLSLLAFHDSWKEFFANLSYVVLDEVHTYKGIFGSHIAQVILRMRRICNLHGSKPQFFASSATVANPGEFVSRLLGEEVAVVDRSGAPSSRRHFLFLNPELSPYTVAARLFVQGLESGLKTIVFTRARKITELITTWVMHEAPHLRNRISSYRAGFLPEERREIERKLFSGQMDGVISTSALEMGIDVGGLDLCVLVGYPGTIINTWQRGGRVGRAGRPSAIVLIAGYDALDQYFLKNPHDFFGRSCEDAILDPVNEEVLKRHLPCAAAETPINATRARYTCTGRDNTSCPSSTCTVAT
ncbi:MAG: DEAD/DEAH box helicase [Deltaproteobacteria bacterium]